MYHVCMQSSGLKIMQHEKDMKMACFKLKVELNRNNSTRHGRVMFCYVVAE